MAHLSTPLLYGVDVGYVYLHVTATVFIISVYTLL